MYTIPIKNSSEIDIMREGGHYLAVMLNVLKERAKDGVDIWDLEELFLEMCKKYNAEPACKGYSMAGFPPFPTGLCLSIDEQAVHCFPIKGRLLKEGDMLTIDTVIKFKNYYLDSAITFGIGKVSTNKNRIMDTTRKALYKAIAQIKPGVRVGKISSTIQKVTEKEGYSVLEDYSGHGIGKQMHEPPEVPCYGRSSDGPRLEAGMVLAVEPLVCENSNVLEHRNFWETKTADYGLFAQEEHTVLVTPQGYEILTKI